MADLKPSIEAILMAAPRPVTVSQIAETFPDATEPAIRETLTALAREYEGRGFELLEVAGGYQVTTRPEYHEVVARYRKARMEKKFTPAALDTLAILAYRQPITRAEVEAVRGAASGEILRALLESGMVRTTGRAPSPGAPLLYGTTPKFLESFGLKDLAELPKPEEMK